eukprot:XP_004918794.2 PREDICTED: leucine-rich repeat, immunoglobulin-like domain and transmembrane domain-containing protein 2 [Xenopus tropicalis]
MDSIFLCITLLLSVAGHGRLQEVPPNCPTGCNCTSVSISCCGSQKNLLLPFSGLNKTTKLSLINCQPLDISQRSFQNMKSLEEIAIRRTPVTFIDSSAFVGFQELKKLSLNELNLSAANTHPLVFNNLSVQLLDLRENNLSLITRQMFRGLKYLRVLDLSRNKIGLIQNRAFESLAQISFLNLDDNSLRTVTPLWFKAYGNYSPLQVSIAGNNMTDECRYRAMDLAENKWFAQSVIPNNSLSFARASALPCSAPSFDNSYQEIYVKESASVILTCSVNSVPTSVLSWLLPTGSTVPSVSNGIVNLTNIQLSNTGTYVCVASNSEGSAVAVTRLLLISPAPTINSPSSAARKASMVLLIIFIAIILLIVCFVVLYILKSVYKLAKEKTASGFEFRQFVDTPNILPVPENPQPMPQL